jgi:antitoxin (DNA-binding transcriptional repressor) of toxin-antitoxin stability system
MTRVMVDDAARQLDTLVEAALHGEIVELVQADGTSVRLVPSESKLRKRQFGSGRGEIVSIADDFDRPIEDFDGYKR